MPPSLYRHLSPLLAFICLGHAAVRPAAAQTGVNARPPSAAPPSTPCPLLGQGGTVFDTSECEQLRATGALFRPSGWVVVAGRPVELRLVGEGRSVPANVPVTLMRTSGPRAVRGALDSLAVRSGADGRVRFVFTPATTGTFQMTVPAGGEAKPKMVCDANGHCFTFCPIATEKNVLTPVAVCDDAPLRDLHLPSVQLSVVSVTADVRQTTDNNRARPLPAAGEWRTSSPPPPPPAAPAARPPGR
ncbi:MAG TPA: hypothetical protein VF541_02235 [Longimicrobium sp.]